MKQVKIIVLSFLIAGLAGCMPHWTQSQCNNIDMHQKGLEDGRAGKNSSAFANYQNDCNSYKITLDHRRYMQGWKAGNREYCKPSNLYEVGKSGKSYPVVCSRQVSQQQAYNRGNKRYRKISNLKSEIDSIDAELNKSQNLQAQYNQKITQIAQDRVTMDLNRNQDTDSARAAYDKARIDMEISKNQARMLHDKIIATTAINAANPQHRQDLMRKRERLENQLIQLQN